MRRYRKGLLAAMLIAAYAASASAIELESPDGNVAVTFSIKDIGAVKSCPVYGVRYKGRVVLADSRLGLELADGPLNAGLRIVSKSSAGGTRLGSRFAASARRSAITTTNWFSISRRHDAPPRPAADLPRVRRGHRLLLHLARAGGAQGLSPSRRRTRSSVSRAITPPGPCTPPKATTTAARCR